MAQGLSYYQWLVTKHKVWWNRWKETNDPQAKRVSDMLMMEKLRIDNHFTDIMEKDEC